jgi:biotin carboxyl carrier protein
VKKVQTLVILEAMKMVNHIESEVDGVVAEVSVSKGDTVLEGEKIVVLD